jgi:tripartite-type tricarboxylate transporter receptor subunit TctC
MRGLSGLAGIAVSLLSLSGYAALAQDAKPADASSWPSQTVRLVTAVAAGSQSDILARALTDSLSKKWGKEVIVENRPGLGGTASIAKSAPDGHTLLLASNGHAMIQALNRNLNFDPVKDFAGVTKIAGLPGILVAPPESGPKTLRELILNAKANPGRYNYASAGLGSASSIAVELLKVDAGITLTHVPYKGLPDAQVSVMRGDTVLFMTFYSAGADLIQAGRMRALAIAGPKRLAMLPDVPTVAEAGVPGYDYDAWFGFLAPAGTPRDVIMKIFAGLQEAAKLPAIQDRFSKLGIDVGTTSPEAMDALLKSDTDRFTRIFGRVGEKTGEKK